MATLSTEPLEWRQEKKAIGIAEAASLFCITASMLGLMNCQPGTNPPPGPLTVSLTASPSSGDVPLTVSFSDTVSGADGPILNTTFDYGDGVIGTSFTHTYTVPGSYVASVMVATKDQSGKASTPVLVGTLALTVAMNAVPLSGVEPLTVVLSASVMGGVTPYVQYSWNSGQGSPIVSSSPSLTINYLASGTYVASVAVTDSAGNTASSNSETITVSPLATCPPGFFKDCSGNCSPIPTTPIRWGAQFTGAINPSVYSNPAQLAMLRNQYSIKWARIENKDVASIPALLGAGFSILFHQGPSNSGPSGMPSPAAYQAQVAALVQSQPNVHHWEFGQESLNPTYGGWTPAQFFPYQQAWYNGVKSVRSTDTVIAPCLAQISNSDGTVNTTVLNWAEALMALGAGSYMDWGSFHMYVDASAVCTSGATMDTFHTALGGKPIWITEIGHPSTNGQNVQASWLDSAFGIVSEKSYINGVSWFCLSDYSQSIAYGLFDAQLNAKLVAAEFEKFASGGGSGGSTFTVHVEDASTSTAIGGASVTYINSQGNTETGTTDSSGDVVLNV